MQGSDHPSSKVREEGGGGGGGAAGVEAEIPLQPLERRPRWSRFILKDCSPRKAPRWSRRKGVRRKEQQRGAVTD